MHLYGPRCSNSVPRVNLWHCLRLRENRHTDVVTKRGHLLSVFTSCAGSEDRDSSFAVQIISTPLRAKGPFVLWVLRESQLGTAPRNAFR
jgi:hypothetical protein